MLDVFSDDRDREIEDLSQTVTGLIRRCEACIHQMGVRNDAGMTTRELAVRQNAQRALAGELQRASMMFRKRQKGFVAVLEKRDNKEWTDVVEDGPIDDIGFNDAQLIELEETERSVEQRSEHITRIARSVQDLHHIFKELAVLVIDQGTVLDRIDYNVEQVVLKAREATVQLEKADKHQRSGRAMKCIFCLMVAIFILIVIITLQHAGK